MHYLLANIFSAACFVLCIKWVGNRRREDIVAIGMINYIVAMLISLPEFFASSGPAFTSQAIWLGATNGLCYFIAFFFCVSVVKWIGVANTTVIGILAIVVPILFGVLLWHERPNPFQVAGIVLAMASLAMIGGKGDAIDRGTVPARPWFAPWIAIGFFLLCGASRLSQEAFKHLCNENERPVYLTMAFVFSAIPAVIYLARRWRQIKIMELMLGMLMGSANIFQIHFILKALDLYDGFIVFPVTSAGSLLLVTLVATGLMGEKLGRLTWLGIAIACVSLFLLKGIPSPV